MTVRCAAPGSTTEVTLRRHLTLEEFEAALGGMRLYCFSARATRSYASVSYQANDCLLFGSESRGLPEGLLARRTDTVLCIPMPAEKVRSLNLATAVGIALYEALRQIQKW